MDRTTATQQLRDRLRNGGVSIGSWMQIPHPSVAEIMGDAGYDWVAVDLEHGAIAPHQLPDRQSNICFGAPMHEISEARCGRKAHREKGGAHVATEQRAMFLVIGRRIGFEVGDRPLQKLRQSWAKVFSDAGSTDAM